MKNFNCYVPEKYASAEYQEIERGIYKAKNPYEDNGDEIYVTSLSFEHEPEMYGEEDGSPRNITQTPFEDLLDEFMVYVTDFYEELNEASEYICYQEFGAFQLENIRRLREIIGKRIYAVPYEEDGEEYHRTTIE